jgi:hypothetical protein
MVDGKGSGRQELLSWVFKKADLTNEGLYERGVAYHAHADGGHWLCSMGGTIFEQLD